MRVAALIALAGALALWLWRDAPGSDAPTEGQPLPPELADEPDFYISGANIRQFTADGALSYVLAAEEIRHFEGRVLTELSAPDLTLYDPDEPPWQVRANRGEITEVADDAGGKTEQVDLHEDVRLRQENAEGFVDMQTDALTVLPDSRIATTERSVKIDSSFGRTRAVGMRTDLATGIIRLGSDAQQRVHTIVLPESLRP